MSEDPTPGPTEEPQTKGPESTTPEVAPPPAGQQPPKQSKKKIYALLVVILLIAAAASYGLLHRNTPLPVTTQQATKPKTTQPKGLVVDSIVYVSRAKTNDPPAIYRQAAGSTTPEVVTTMKTTDDYPYNLIASGQNLAYSTKDGIYVSRDNGKTFKNILPLDATKAESGQAITSLHFSNDGKQIVFAYLPDTSSKNTVKAMNLDGSNLIELSTFDRIGVFVLHYNPAKKTLIYQTGCFFCDGARGTPHLLDLATKKDTQLITPDDTKIFNTYAVSNDGNKLLYYTGTKDSVVEEQSGGVGWQGAAPFKVMEADIASGQTTELATIGTSREKDATGKYKEYFLTVGYTADTQKPFYTASSTLFVMNGAEFKMVFEGSGSIYEAPPFVSKTEVYFSQDAPIDNVTGRALYHYDIASKKSSLLYQSKELVSSFVVTTKL